MKERKNRREIQFSEHNIEIKDDDDLKSVTMRRDYHRTPALQYKVEDYFKRKYPGKMTYGG